MPGPNLDCRCAVQHHHGTHQCYRTCGCRTQECKDANAAEVRAARRRRNYGTSTTHLTDASPVRKHVQKLFKRGWGVRATSKETGVSEKTINVLLYGSNGKLSATVQAGTAAKLLAFNPPFDRNNRQGTRIETVDSIGAQRRLQALVTLGFSLNWLAEYAGYGRSYFKAVLAADTIALTTADVVSDLYERLWNKRPIPETRAQKQSVTHAKRFAKANGWLPPMAWDDDQIDNPKYRAAA